MSVLARADLEAVDCHVHLSDERWARSAAGARARDIARHFGREPSIVSADEMADDYRSRKMMAVIMSSTDVTVTGREPVPNDHVADIVRSHDDVFLGFGAVDPWQGQLARDEIRRCKELGLVGIGELNPARQHFFPHDHRFYPLWELAEELGLVVLFHGGYAAAGSGRPGGDGVKLRFGRPIYLDDVAADFPSLKIICAHPSWPWESEALATAQHKANVYLDLSGWAPKYFSPELRQHVNSRISRKVLFGSDWPSLGVERWLEEFDGLDLKPEVRRAVLLENALELFGLGREVDSAGT